MFGFLLRRIGLLIPTFLGVTFIAFMFIRVLPGDPVITWPVNAGSPRNAIRN